MSETDDTTGIENTDLTPKEDGHRITHLKGMYENWFLDYASYVILERAVPEIDDGLKPVQRRILHSMSRLDDGRFNKVANIIGHTMQFHPHGDASIGDALVQLGQKELLIDMQGNWGNTATGDSAAAPRYIEARLSKFAKEVVFNPKTTNWKSSYDARNKEPITLPVKFPLLLAQGVEGIAVGLASKILPHNFNELIDASIDCLQGKDFELLPDFLTGGMADFSKYNEGLRGGKVRIRAKIAQIDKKTLVIKEIPFSTTTTSVIDSIVAATDKGKIKIRKIDDNTAGEVEIVIHLAPNVSPDQTIDALYAFTNCELSISPNNCVIEDGKPRFVGVIEILRSNTNNTLTLLRTELEIRLNELEDNWHNASLEKIFIENRIYLDIEDCETWECVLSTIDKGLTPFKTVLRRPVTEDDLVRLTEIKIKRISKFNAFKANDSIAGIEAEMEEVKNHLNHIVDFAINYFRQIKKKYGKGKERKTEIRNFDNINASTVAVANEKLYVDREGGFIGTALKKDEYVTECSDIDDIIVFRENGIVIVCKVAPKVFVGQGIIHADVFKKNDDRTVYNMVYRDGKLGNYYVKRFAMLGVTRDKEYDLTSGAKDSKVVYFTANPNGEAEIVKISLRPRAKLKKLHFDFDFSELAIKGRGSKGNRISKNAIKSIVQREEGVSTLGALNIWYDDTVRRLNSDERGVFLGDFSGDDKILTMLSSGEYKLSAYDLATHFDDNMISINKFDVEKVISAVYYDGEQGAYFIKRFHIPENSMVNKNYLFISESKGSKLVVFSLDYLPRISYEIKNEKNNSFDVEVLPLADFISVKSVKAKGKKLTSGKIKSIKLIDPLPFTANESDITDDDDSDENLIQEEDNNTINTDTETPDNNQSESNKSEPKPEVEVEEDKLTPPLSSETKPPLPRKHKPGENPPQLELEF